MDSNVSDTANEVLKRYYQYRFLDDMVGRVGSRFAPSRGEKLDEKQKMLDIMEKQRRLGLPVDSEDYEDAVNNDKSFYSQITRSGTKRVLQAIPGPNPLSSKPQPFFRIAEAIVDELPSMKKTPHNFGGKYGRAIGSAAGAIGTIFSL